MNYRKDLLSYTSSIIKIVVCIIAMPWMVSISDDYEYGVIFAILGLILLLICWNAYIETGFTRLNRKLRTLSSMNINEIESLSYAYTEVVRIIKDKGYVFFIIKSQSSIFRIGVRKVHGDREIGYTYYYISAIQNGKVARSEFKDFDQFIQVLNQVNGYRDTFDVVSVDKIVVPKKKS